MDKLILGTISRAANRHVRSTPVLICVVILFLAATAHAETSRVKVVTIHQGAAIGDTEVLLYSPTGKKLDYQGISNAEGSIIFHIPAGAYKFCVKRSGARIWSDVVHTLPGEETNVTLDLEQLARDNTRDPNPVRFDGTPPEEEPVMLASLTGLAGILTQNTVAAVSKDRLYWFVNDHLGTPVMIIDENQDVVWEGSHEPFGDTFITVNTIENNFRFPGQYFDTESGLHYNYHRYYDPSIGRYLRTDPIGLKAGINLFTYSELNPINLIDPLGLEALDSGMIRTIAPETNAIVSAGYATSIVGLDASREIVSTETIKTMEAKDWKYSFSPTIIGTSFFVQFEDRDATPWLKQKATQLLGYWPDSDASATIGLSKHFGAALSLDGKVTFSAGVFIPIYPFFVHPTLPRDELMELMKIVCQ